MRTKSFREYLLDLKKPEDERSDFVYAKNGTSVSPDALVIPEYGPYDPVKKLARIEAIFRAYAALQHTHLFCCCQRSANF